MIPSMFTTKPESSLYWANSTERQSSEQCQPQRAICKGCYADGVHTVCALALVQRYSYYLCTA